MGKKAEGARAFDMSIYTKVLNSHFVNSAQDRRRTRSLLVKVQFSLCIQLNIQPVPV